MNNEFDLAEFDKVASDIQAIKDKGNFIPDCSTKEGYTKSKRLVLDVILPARKALESAHKDTKKPFLDKCKFLDSKKNELMQTIKDVELPHKEAYRSIDQEILRKKEEAQKAIQDRINLLDEMVGKAYSNISADDLAVLLDECNAYEVDSVFFDHRTIEVKLNKANSIKKIEDRLSQQIEVEKMKAQQAELERLKSGESDRIAEEKEKEREDERLRLQREGEEKAAKDKIESDRLHALSLKSVKEEAEQAAVEAKEKAQIAVKEAKEKATQDELNRQEDKKWADIAEQKKKDDNKIHVGKVRREAKEYLISTLGLNEKTAEIVVLEIARGHVPHVRIRY